MHYRNGRQAKAGDVVVDLLYGHMGVLHSLLPGSDTCNGKLAKVATGDPYVNVKDCVHIDDINAAFPSKPQGEQGNPT